LAISVIGCSLLVAASLTLYPSLVVSLCFVVPLAVPLLIKFMMTGGILYFALSAILLLALTALLIFAHRQRTVLQKSIQQQLENSRLTALASDAQKQFDGVNDKFSQEAASRGRIEAELKAAKMSAEAANMAKDEFLATMSHEIRTPLNGILPILDILGSTKLSPVQQDYLNTALQSSKHLLTIIDDILDYSKIEAGKLELEIVGINLRELLDSVVRLMTGSAQKKGLDLNIQIDPKVRVAMRGDPVRLRQILTNLVSNAIKFTDSGNVTIGINKRAESRTQTELLFTVRDTGIGMDKQTADKLFLPFSQAQASTTRTYGGTGLGLAICKRLVDVMQGKIGVKSQPNQGSVFWFAVPLKKSVGDIQKGRKQLHESNALIMSEDPQLLQRLNQFAESFSMRRSTAGKLQEALSKIKSVATLGSSWAFDLFIFDVGTSNNSEKILELAKAVRSEPKLANAGVLLLNEDGVLPEPLSKIGGISTRKRSSSESIVRQSLENLLTGEGDMDTDVVAERELGYVSGSKLPTEKIPGKALLVEDNPVNLHVAQKLLGIVGLEFDVAKNGQEALQLLERTQFDVVLMDCMMPIMDGYTATREWRKTEAAHKAKPTPIIAMTANAMAGDREKCLDAGMDDYMSKPLNRQVLTNMLKQWIGKSKSPETGKAKPALKIVETPIQKPAGESATVSPISSSKALDQQVLDDLTEIMGDDFKDLISVFLEDSPRALNKLSAAAQSGILADLIDPAHSLKSSSAI